MTEKHIMIDLNDEKAGKIAEVLSSKVCKSIISTLAEKNLSESDLAKELKLPLNTLEYNLKKLISVGLVEKSSDYFWSSKGKKIPVYKVINRNIIISPSKMSGTLKSVITTGLVAGLASVGIKIYSINNSALSYLSQADVPSYALNSGSEKMAGVASDSASQAIPTLLSVNVPIWLWFMAGAFFALLVFLILNWRKL